MRAAIARVPRVHNRSGQSGIDWRVYQAFPETTGPRLRPGLRCRPSRRLRQRPPWFHSCAAFGRRHRNANREPTDTFSAPGTATQAAARANCTHTDAPKILRHRLVAPPHFEKYALARTIGFNPNDLIVIPFRHQGLLHTISGEDGL